MEKQYKIVPQHPKTKCAQMGHQILYQNNLFLKKDNKSLKLQAMIKNKPLDCLKTNLKVEKKLQEKMKQ